MRLKANLIWVLAGIITGNVLGIAHTMITSSTQSSGRELQVVQSDREDLSDEQVYKYSCKPIMNSDIMDSKNGTEFKDELIAFVGKVDEVKELQDESYMYIVNDIGLSDGGGLWTTVSPNKFEIGDMVIIYGSNAIRDGEYVSIDAKYMEIYRE